VPLSYSRASPSAAGVKISKPASISSHGVNWFGIEHSGHGGRETPMGGPRTAPVYCSRSADVPTSHVLIRQRLG
jgi:hypothetical protein